MHTILNIQNGCFSYSPQHPLLMNINLSLKKGEIMAVMGKNGIGKTTFIKCIVGILNWNRGFSMINGNINQKHKPLDMIGYVPQAHKISFSYTVRDMVVFGKVGHRSYFASPSRQDYEIADELLRKVGIYHLRYTVCNKLSGGQMQMVFIARALVNSPQLLVLDEPEAHLDFRNQLHLLKLLHQLAKEHEIACVINTHYPNHALRIADTCFLLGEQDHVIGKIDEVMTDDNIRKYFGVSSYSAKFQYKDEIITSFTFLDEV